MRRDSMLTDSSLKKISNIIIGDEGDYFKYKSGYELVHMFNSYFGQNDTYGSGFPSRWIYVYNKLVDRINNNSVDNFFSVILSIKYMMIEHDCSQIEAAEWSEKARNGLNEILAKESFKIIKKGNNHFLINENTDLVLIGSGGFADAYLQKSTGLVIKKLREDFWFDEGIKSRFKREYLITKELSELNGIITVYDFNKSDYSYSMEKAELTFDKYITENSLSEDNKIKCIRIILHIMKSVHDKDIIHRDLSPNNIFILHGEIKIADFGLGKDLNMFTSHQTIHTQAVGQYYYCAPEQFMMLRDGDKRSDVYSLGRIINFIMTGKPTDSHHSFRSVSEKATNTDSAYRYGDASQLLQAFEKSVEYQKDENRKDMVMGKIEKGILDDSVDAFIYEIPSQEICKLLVSEEKQFDSVLIKFMKQDEERANYIIQTVDSSFREVCYSFESYDPIAKFAFDVLSEKFGFTVKEIAANILRFVAFDVNRFYAQRLVESIKEQGLEPLLEEILC